MGITYKELDTYITTGEADERVKGIVDELNRKSQHKREGAKIFVPQQ
jgi:NAD+ synthase